MKKIKSGLSQIECPVCDSRLWRNGCPVAAYIPGTWYCMNCNKYFDEFQLAFKKDVFFSLFYNYKDK